MLKGASKDDAFRIGKEIVKAVTADNPKPVKLKFEKVIILKYMNFMTIISSLSYRYIYHVYCRQRSDMLGMHMKQ